MPMERLVHIVRVWVLWIARVAMVSMTNVNVCTPDSIEGAGFRVRNAMAKVKFMLNARLVMVQDEYERIKQKVTPVGQMIYGCFCRILLLG